MGFKHSSFHNKLESKHSFFDSLKQNDSAVSWKGNGIVCPPSMRGRWGQCVTGQLTPRNCLATVSHQRKRVYQYHLFILLFCYLRSNSFIHLLLDSSSSVKFLQRDIILRKGLVTPQNGFVTFTGVIAPVWGQAGSTVIASCLAVIGGQPSAKDTSQNNRSSKESPWLSVASRPHLQPKVWRVTSLTFVSVSPCRAGTCARAPFPRLPQFLKFISSKRVKCKLSFRAVHLRPTGFQALPRLLSRRSFSGQAAWAAHSNIRRFSSKPPAYEQGFPFPSSPIGVENNFTLWSNCGKIRFIFLLQRYSWRTWFSLSNSSPKVIFSQSNTPISSKQTQQSIYLVFQFPLPLDLYNLN